MPQGQRPPQPPNAARFPLIFPPLFLMLCVALSCIFPCTNLFDLFFSACLQMPVIVSYSPYSETKKISAIRSQNQEGRVFFFLKRGRGDGRENGTAIAKAITTYSCKLLNIMSFRNDKTQSCKHACTCLNINSWLIDAIDFDGAVKVEYVCRLLQESSPQTATQSPSEPLFMQGSPSSWIMIFVSGASQSPRLSSAPSTMAGWAQKPTVHRYSWEQVLPICLMESCFPLLSMNI